MEHLDLWSVLCFGALSGVSYGAWCFGRLPRMRRLFAVLSVLCLAAAVVLHNVYPHQAAGDHGYYP